GLPVDFGLFPGNNTDVTTFLPMINRTRERMGLNKMIYVGDKGCVSSSMYTIKNHLNSNS
ncbi:MAG: hypothetical protein RBT04_10500, partial [Sphaerochaetaceae bacterium]|nr:hypothetical protein [Sphaerochaetaceae bacterium]